MEGEVINRKHFPFWSLKMGTFSVPSFGVQFSSGVGGEAFVLSSFMFQSQAAEPTGLFV